LYHVTIEFGLPGAGWAPVDGPGDRRPEWGSIVGLFGRLFGGKGAPQSDIDSDGLHIYVRCDKCGEKIHIRANKRTDISQEYTDGGENSAPMLHKEILGSRCQNLMYVHLTLDGANRVVASDTERCAVITRAEFDAQ
jgi:hypothetical protein